MTITIQDITETDEGNECVGEVIRRILEIPGVNDAVMLDAISKFGGDELKCLHNEGCASLADLPFFHIWSIFHGPWK